MTGEPAPKFAAAAREALADTRARRELRAAAAVFGRRRAAVPEPPDWAELRESARAIRDATLADLDTHLERLEEAVTEAGGTVHWAADAAQARRIITALTREVGATRIVRDDSPTIRELALDAALSRAGITTTTRPADRTDTAPGSPSDARSPAGRMTPEQPRPATADADRRIPGSQGVARSPVGRVEPQEPRPATADADRFVPGPLGDGRPPAGRMGPEEPRPAVADAGPLVPGSPGDGGFPVGRVEPKESRPAVADAGRFVPGSSADARSPVGRMGPEKPRPAVADAGPLVPGSRGDGRAGGGLIGSDGTEAAVEAAGGAVPGAVGDVRAGVGWIGSGGGDATAEAGWGGPGDEGADDGGVAVVGADFMVVETGTLVFVEEGDDDRVSGAGAETLIAVGGIEMVVPQWRDMEVLLQLLPRSLTGERMTPLVSCLTGVTPGDGPQAVHLVLVDNGRTRVLEDEIGRAALRCIRCRACHHVCPVYERTGGTPYGPVHSGPIGAILTPQLRGVESAAAASLPYASTLCGACADVCPVLIDIPEVLVHLRGKVVESRRARSVPPPELVLMRGLAWTMGEPRRYEAALRRGTRWARLAARGGRIRRLPGLLGAWTDARDLPAPPAEPFRAWWARRRR